MRYHDQKFSMVTPQAKATLNDIATEEMAHLEMVGTMVHQLTRGLTEEQIKAAGLDPYYVAHGLGVYPSAASGVPFSAAYIQSKGDPITDLYEDMADRRCDCVRTVNGCYNFKLHKFSITIKKDRSAGPETVKSADKR